jgi:hypothetical protein
MGIYANQYTVAKLINKDGKMHGREIIKGLPLMTLAQAQDAAEIANKQGNDTFVAVNTLAD